MKRVIEFLVLVAVMLVTAVCSVYVASERVAAIEIAVKQDHELSCNHAMQVGFRIYDADGFEVERFNGRDYWTKQPKP